MSIDTLYNLILAAVVLIACYASYCAGRNDGRREGQRQESRRQEPPTWMDHTHGGEDDG